MFLNTLEVRAASECRHFALRHSGIAGAAYQDEKQRRLQTPGLSCSICFLRVILATSDAITSEPTNQPSFARTALHSTGNPLHRLAPTCKQLDAQLCLRQICPGAETGSPKGRMLGTLTRTSLSAHDRRSRQCPCARFSMCAIFAPERADVLKVPSIPSKIQGQSISCYHHAIQCPYQSFAYARH
jgi:hypothetical protein